jgi:polar amino acid transport system substrate-binding protein
MSAALTLLRRWLPLLGVLALGGCGPTPQGQTGATTLERIRQAGVVRLGFANEAPYAYLDQTTGRLTGEAPEIARVILRRMGIPQVQGVLTEWGALIPGLEAGRFDIIAAGMYITPARCRQVAFTDPTYGIGEAFAVKAGNPLSLHAYSDLAAHPKARLGVVAGTVELGYARASEVPQGRIALLPDNATALAALETGRIDAFAGTSLTVADLLGKAGAGAGLARALPFRQPVIQSRAARGYGAFAVRRRDRALLRELDRQLAAFIGSPAHRRLVAPFGFTVEDLPQGATAAQLCRPAQARAAAAGGAPDG